MNSIDFSSIEGRLALLEDKITTLTALVSKFGLLSPDVVELKLSVSALTLVVAKEAARSAEVEMSQSHWNARHGSDLEAAQNGSKDTGTTT